MERKEVVVVSLFTGAEFGKVDICFSLLRAINARLRVGLLQEYVTCSPASLFGSLPARLRLLFEELLGRCDVSYANISYFV